MSKLVIKSLATSLLIFNLLLLASGVAYAEWENTASDCNNPILTSLEPEAQGSQLYLTLDRTFSPIVGADLMIFALRGYEALDDCLIPSTEGDTSLSLILSRFGKFLFEGTLSSTLMIIQHEVFGHGARAREFHLPVTSYTIRPFSGSTGFLPIQYESLPLQERIAITAGGMEATSILANRIRERWLYADRIDSREANLYLLSSFDQTEYIRSTKNLEKPSLGDDVQAYVTEINTWYGKRVLTVDKLRKRVLIDYLDPFFYYSLYSIGNYVITGAQIICDFPMIPIGDCRYLPAARLALAPYGPEYQFLNYIKTPEHLIQLSYRWGNTGGQHSRGLNLNVSNVWTSDLLFLDTLLSAWTQPKLFTAHAKPHNTHFGFAASLIARYQVIDKIAVMGQLGYKTTGFLQGETLKRGVIARIGLVMQL